MVKEERGFPKKRPSSRSNLNKRGQFYLLAAVIIVGVIGGFASIMIYSQEENTEIKVKDIKEELGLESAQVIDYGTYNNSNTSEMIDLTKNFSKQFSEYSSKEGRSLSFVVGNPDENKVYRFNYTDVSTGSVSVGGGNTPSMLNINKRGFKQGPITPGKDRNISIGNREVKLDKGFNFYFVMQQRTDDGEVHIVEGDEGEKDEKGEGRGEGGWRPDQSQGNN